jgi:hypothetical protein
LAFVFDGCQIEELKLPHVSDLEFTWMAVNQCGEARDGERLAARNGNSVQIYFTQNGPASPLQGTEVEGSSNPKLLVAMYAWDSNSYPGNEYVSCIYGR